MAVGWGRGREREKRAAAAERALTVTRMRQPRTSANPSAQIRSRVVVEWHAAADWTARHCGGRSRSDGPARREWPPLVAAVVRTDGRRASLHVVIPSLHSVHAHSQWRLEFASPTQMDAAALRCADRLVSCRSRSVWSSDGCGETTCGEQTKKNPRRRTDSTSSHRIALDLDLDQRSSATHDG